MSDVLFLSLDPTVVNIRMQLSEQFKHHHSKSIHVCSFVSHVVGIRQLLERHILKSSLPSKRRNVLFSQDRKAKIGNLKFIPLQENVCQLKVLMQYPILKQDSIATNQLIKYVGSSFLSQQGWFSQYILQSAIGAVFHEYVKVSCRKAFEREYSHQILMLRQQANDVNFTLNLTSFDCISSIRDYFDCQEAPFIIGRSCLVDNSECALPQFFTRVSIDEELSLFSSEAQPSNQFYFLLHQVLYADFIRLINKVQLTFLILSASLIYRFRQNRWREDSKKKRGEVQFADFNHAFIMQREVFEKDEGALQRGLFGEYSARWGAQTKLNVNFIPDLLQWVKGQLRGEQLLRLEDYHLQNYLMELSVCYGGERSLASVGSQILEHIRTHNNFWYRNNNQQQLQQEQTQQHQAISRYRQDLICLADQLTEMPTKAKSGQFFPPPQHFQPYRRKKTAGNCIFHLLRRNTEPHFGTRQPLNHLALLPAFLSKDLEQAQMVQECILFLLSNKATNTIRRVEVPVGAESQESSEEEQLQQTVTLLDQFEQYMQEVGAANKLPNSHHMRTLTHNLIASCRQLLKLPPSQLIRERTQASGPLQLLGLSQTITDILCHISQRELSDHQLVQIAKFFLHRWQNGLQIAIKQMRQREMQTLAIEKGWVSSIADIQKVKSQYQEMLDNPEFVELTRCRAVGSGVPWKEEDYLNFLKALGDFLNIPTNNKKIASAMGDSIEPNHVKHVKAVYLAVMKERLERGECGGGKRGKSLSKADFLQKDIASFSMRWFQKAKKIRKRKPKRKRRNSSQQEAEDDHDSEY